MDCLKDSFAQKGKFSKVHFTGNEISILRNVIEDSLFRIEENGNRKSKEYKETYKIYTKIVKAYNKTGIYYLWQLKDRDGDVTYENIEDEWK